MTAWPSSQRISSDRAGVLGLDGHLHLHRLEDHDGVALVDAVADLDLDLPHRARDVGLDLGHARPPGADIPLARAAPIAACRDRSSSSPPATRPTACRHDPARARGRVPGRARGGRRRRLARRDRPPGPAGRGRARARVPRPGQGRGDDAGRRAGDGGGAGPRAAHRAALRRRPGGERSTTGAVGRRRGAGRGRPRHRRLRAPRGRRLRPRAAVRAPGHPGPDRAGPASADLGPAGPARRTSCRSSSPSRTASGWRSG